MKSNLTICCKERKGCSEPKMICVALLLTSQIPTVQLLSNIKHADSSDQQPCVSVYEQQSLSRMPRLLWATSRTLWSTRLSS